MKYLFDCFSGVKYDHWQYENEYRILTNSNSRRYGLMNHDHYLPFMRVSGIIVGERCKITENFHDLCLRHKIDLYEARCFEKEYKIDLVEILKYGEHLKSVCECDCMNKIISKEQESRGSDELIQFLREYKNYILEN